jgi:hypothetical protein
MSSDDDLICFFMEWLKDIGKITNEEILLDIYIGEDKKDLLYSIIEHWSKITGINKKEFHRIYIHKTRPKKLIKNYINVSRFGILRIRVKSSSMLARQIFGWIIGIKKSIGI